MFGTIVRFKRWSAVELLTTRCACEWRGAVDVGVGGPDMMCQIIDVSKHERAHGAHRLACRQPRQVVRVGVTPQRRGWPEPPRTQRTWKRRLDAGDRVRRPTVDLQRRLAVRFVAALVADKPVSIVDDGHVRVKLRDDEKRLVAQRALVRSHSGVAQHMNAQQARVAHLLAALAAQ